MAEGRVDVESTTIETGGDCGGRSSSLTDAKDVISGDSRRDESTSCPTLSAVDEAAVGSQPGAGVIGSAENISSVTLSGRGESFTFSTSFSSGYDVDAGTIFVIVALGGGETFAGSA